MLIYTIPQMKIYIYTLLSSLGLCCLAFSYDPYIETKIDADKVKELASITQPVRTINPADTNYQDLLFLKEKLKNVDMVMLGEQQHGDGSTFLAKSRLVKFLHEELDFDVLFFESNVYDCFRFWEDISGEKKNKSTDFGQALFGHWANATEMKDLQKYMVRNAKSSNPLSLAGFDILFSGNMSYWKRIQFMETYLTKKNILFNKDYPAFLKILDDYHYNTYSYPSKQIPATEKQAVFNEIERLITVLAKDQQTNEDKIFSRYLSGIQAELNYRWLYPDDEEKQLIVRDSMMAQNVIWLKDHVYKNKKIILWAANSHILHNTQHLKDSPFYYKRMGTYLQDKYGRSCYSINFTSYSGQTHNIVTGESNSINESISNSVESMLHEIGNPFAWIDCRSIPENSFLNEKITMKFLGHGNHTEQWSKMMDAAFFIDQMKPITFN